MKLSEFADTLERAGLPVTYKAFREGNVPSLPYLVYFESLPSITGADNQASYKIRAVTVELAFERKDEELGCSGRKFYRIRKTIREVL